MPVSTFWPCLQFLNKLIISLQNSQWCQHLEVCFGYIPYLANSRFLNFSRRLSVEIMYCEVVLAVRFRADHGRSPKTVLTLCFRHCLVNDSRPASVLHVALDSSASAVANIRHS
jgi:hypothetical protein